MNDKELRAALLAKSTTDLEDLAKRLLNVCKERKRREEIEKQNKIKKELQEELQTLLDKIQDEGYDIWLSTFNQNIFAIPSEKFDIRLT